MKWRNLILGVMVIMAIGSADNSNVQRPALTKSSVDLNELAARLGARSVMERGGELLWQDSFGQGLAPYEYTLDAFGSTIVIDSFSSPSSGYSAKLQTAINANANLTIDKVLPLINVNTAAFETRISITQLSDNVYVSLVYTKDRVQHGAGIRYHPVTNALEYINSLGNYVALDTLDPAIVGRKFYYYAKIQVDIVNSKYGFVYFNGKSYDLRQQSLQTLANPFLDNIFAQITMPGNGTSANIINIGDWVITRNEILQ